MTEQHAWMSDPLVADIPQKKLEFLEQLYYNSQGKNQKDLMTFMTRDWPARIRSSSGLDRR